MVSNKKRIVSFSYAKSKDEIQTVVVLDDDVDGNNDEMLEILSVMYKEQHLVTKLFFDLKDYFSKKDKPKSYDKYAIHIIASVTNDENRFIDYIKKYMTKTQKNKNSVHFLYSNDVWTIHSSNKN